MRTETEIRARLEAMKKKQKQILTEHAMWLHPDMRYQIIELEWVLGDDEK